MAHNDPRNAPKAARPAKLIDLRDHKSAEQLLDRLLDTDPEAAEYQALLDRAADTGSPFLAALVRRLDSSRPQRLQALGGIARAYPSRARAVQALLETANDRRLSDDRRMGAMMVLNQYLGVPPVSDFIAGLRNPVQAAVNSLVGTLNDCADHPEMLQDYFRALITQPDDVLHSVLKMVEEVEGAGAVAALQILALQPDVELMAGAIKALQARDEPGARLALAVLEPNLPPEQSRQVSRFLSKGRLSGQYTAPPLPPAEGCRALLSPVDEHAEQVLLLLCPGDDAGADAGVAAVGLRLKEGQGIVAARGLFAVRLEDLPDAVASGTVHRDIPAHLSSFLGEKPGAELMLLEVPYGYGLRLVRENIKTNWHSATPVPVEYQLMVQFVWRDAPDAEHADLAQWSETGVAGTLAEEEGELLAHPAFAGWRLESGRLLVTVEELLSRDRNLPYGLGAGERRVLLPVAIKLAHTEFNIELRRSYSERFRLMSEWLALAGDERNSRLAASASRTMLSSPPEANMLAVELVQKGLFELLRDSRAGSGSRQ